MALKVKAVERLVKFKKNEPGQYRYVMQPELYTSLSQTKVIKEAALRSGVSRGVMQACWDAAGEVIKAWATEGHSVALPGLGTMRFGLRAKSVEKVEDVNNGDEVKRVTSSDPGTVEDPENEENGGNTENGNGSGSGSEGGNTNGGNTGGNTGGGNDGGDDLDKN